MCQGAAGSTLVGLRQREYTAPAWKYPATFRERLPSHLESLLDWSLPLRDPEGTYKRTDPVIVDSHLMMAPGGAKGARVAKPPALAGRARY